jgi:hypothetical protein
LRAFASPCDRVGGSSPLPTPSARCSGASPSPNDQFRHLATLDAIDAATLAWRDAVRNGSAFYGGWPAFVNVPSKIAKVAAVRELAAQRRDSELRRRAHRRLDVAAGAGTGVRVDAATRAGVGGGAVPGLSGASDGSHHGRPSARAQFSNWRPASVPAITDTSSQAGR